MNKVKQHFKEEALKFDKIIRRSIPFYSQMVEAIVDFLHFTGKTSPEIPFGETFEVVEGSWFYRNRLRVEVLQFRGFRREKEINEAI